MTVSEWLKVLPTWIGIITGLLFTVGAFIWRLNITVRDLQKSTQTLSHQTEQESLSSKSAKTLAEENKIKLSLLVQQAANQQQSSLDAFNDIRRDIEDQKESRKEVWGRLDKISGDISKMGADISYLRGRSNGLPHE